MNCTLPIKTIDHGASWKAAGDAGTGQCHGTGGFAQVVPDCSNPIHVTSAGAQAAGHSSYASLPNTGIVTSLGYRCGI